MVKGTGIYVFYEEPNFLYVGKCSSRHFIERVTSHFDPRLNGWFNSFLKILIKKEDSQSGDDKQKLMNSQLKKIFSKEENYKLCLIYFDHPEVKKINKIETILRNSKVLNPLNHIDKNLDIDQTLEKSLQ